MPIDFRDEDSRRAIEEALDKAIDKWLDKQFSVFGKWSFRGLLALVFGVALYIYFHTAGLKQ